MIIAKLNRPSKGLLTITKYKVHAVKLKYINGGIGNAKVLYGLTRLGCFILRTNTPRTVAKEFNASVNPAKIRIDSKLEVMINIIAINDCVYMAVVGILSSVFFDRNFKIVKSSPIT